MKGTPPALCSFALRGNRYCVLVQQHDGDHSPVQPMQHYAVIVDCPDTDGGERFMLLCGAQPIESAESMSRRTGVPIIKCPECIEIATEKGYDLDLEMDEGRIDAEAS